MNLGDDSRDLFSARLLFRGWPHPAVVCPVCESANVELVSVEVCRDGRMTVTGEREPSRALPDSHVGKPPDEDRLLASVGEARSRPATPLAGGLTRAAKKIST